MATITEDYISFETAKLLKEKGFPQEYDDYHALVYNEEDYEDEYEVQRFVLETKLVKAGTLSSYPIGVPEPKCYCCTLQMAMKWLREVQGLHISLEPCYDYDSMHVVFLAFVQNVADVHEFFDGRKNVASYPNAEKSYELAIKYCLENLI